MSDILTQDQRSALMARVCSAGNASTELLLIFFFRAHGIKGWRRRFRIAGKPDFVFPKLRVAVFVDGCFWHGCPKHGRTPKTRSSFWSAKITGNKARDKRVNRHLRTMGWKVIRVWEHELIRKNESRLLKRLKKHLSL